MATDFPVDQAINPLLQALKAHGRAILEAPPGAGKSTRVPLALLDSEWGQRLWPRNGEKPWGSR